MISSRRPFHHHRYGLSFGHDSSMRTSPLVRVGWPSLPIGFDLFAQLEFRMPHSLRSKGRRESRCLGQHRVQATRSRNEISPQLSFTRAEPKGLGTRDSVLGKKVKIL